jgi:small subunit ribosomal protein S4
MAKNLNSKCKLCRRAGEKLFLKGERCFTAKCAMERRPFAPGQHGQAQRRGGSEFGRQLAMKQKIKRLYGVMERQFRKHYAEAAKRHGITGDELMGRLERRLDNVIYRSGMASSRSQARQLVSHKMFSLNGKRMNIPSVEVKVGDSITLKENKKAKTYFTQVAENLSKKSEVPHWVAVDSKNMNVTITALPTREDVGVRVDPQMVVEYYSK